MTQKELDKILELHALWLKNAPTGVRANLSGVNLSDANLSGANLSGARLSHVNLSGANIFGANLSGAELPTILNRVWFYGANLLNIKNKIFIGCELRCVENLDKENNIFIDCKF